MSQEVSFRVYGEAMSAGSKRSIPHPNAEKRRAGKFLVLDDNPRSAQWKLRVAQEAGRVFPGPLLEGALEVELVFWRTRPAGHFGTGRNAGVVKDSAPAHPATRPDLDKTSRAILDSLTGVVYRDDAQIVRKVAEKRFGEQACVDVTVRCCAEQTAGEVFLAAQGELAAAA